MATLAEALEYCEPQTRQTVSLELRLARATRIMWAWAIKNRRECPFPVKVKGPNPPAAWVVNVPGYELTKDRGYVMRDFVGNNPTQVFIEAAERLGAEDPSLHNLESGHG